MRDEDARMRRVFEQKDKKDSISFVLIKWKGSMSSFLRKRGVYVLRSFLKILRHFKPRGVSLSRV